MTVYLVKSYAKYNNMLNFILFNIYDKHIVLLYMSILASLYTLKYVIYVITSYEHTYDSFIEVHILFFHMVYFLLSAC